MLPIHWYISWDLKSSYSGTEREALLQMEISLLNVNIFYKRVTSTLFLQLFLHLLFLTNNQPKTIVMPRSHILEWQILFPFTLLENQVKDKKKEQGCFYVHVSIRSPHCLCLNRGPTSKDTCSKEHRSCFLMSSFNKEEGLLRSVTDIGLGQEKYKMILGDLWLPESQSAWSIMEVCQENTGANWRLSQRPSQMRDDLSNNKATPGDRNTENKKKYPWDCTDINK